MSVRTKEAPHTTEVRSLDWERLKQVQATTSQPKSPSVPKATPPTTPVKP